MPGDCAGHSIPGDVAIRPFWLVWTKWQFQILISVEQRGHLRRKRIGVDLQSLFNIPPKGLRAFNWNFKEMSRGMPNRFKTHHVLQLYKGSYARLAFIMSWESQYSSNKIELLDKQSIIFKLIISWSLLRIDPNWNLHLNSTFSNFE